MKKWFKNLTKGKLAIGVLALCLLVFGGYFGYHKFIVKADSMPNRAVVNRWKIIANFAPEVRTVK